MCEKTAETASPAQESCCTCAQAREACRRAGRIAGRAVLLGLKLTRAVLDEGIQRLQSELEREEPQHKGFRKITIQ